MENQNKTVENINAENAKQNVPDIKFWGDGNTFKLISKAFSKNEGWMKSTKAMEIENLGCVIQVTTQQGSYVSEALTYVANCKISEEKNQEGEVISRKIVKF
jgi:hypothetical protein